LINDIGCSRSPLESMEDIRLALRDRHQLLLFTETTKCSIEDWEAFAALVDHLRKSSLPLPLSVIVIDTRSVVSCEPTFQFVLGHTSLRVFEGAAALDENTVWSRYLHMRAWWDSGG